MSKRKKNMNLVNPDQPFQFKRAPGVHRDARKLLRQVPNEPLSTLRVYVMAAREMKQWGKENGVGKLTLLKLIDKLCDDRVLNAHEDFWEHMKGVRNALLEHDEQEDWS